MAYSNNNTYNNFRRFLQHRHHRLINRHQLQRLFRRQQERERFLRRQVQLHDQNVQQQQQQQYLIKQTVEQHYEQDASVQQYQQQMRVCEHHQELLGQGGDAAAQELLRAINRQPPSAAAASSTRSMQYTSSYSNRVLSEQEAAARSQYQQQEMLRQYEQMVGGAVQNRPQVLGYLQGQQPVYVQMVGVGQQQYAQRAQDEKQRIVASSAIQEEDEEEHLANCPMNPVHVRVVDLTDNGEQRVDLNGNHGGVEEVAQQQREQLNSATQDQVVDSHAYRQQASGVSTEQIMVELSKQNQLLIPILEMTQAQLEQQMYQTFDLTQRYLPAATDTPRQGYQYAPPVAISPLPQRANAPEAQQNSTNVRKPAVASYVRKTEKRSSGDSDADECNRKRRKKHRKVKLRGLPNNPPKKPSRIAQPLTINIPNETTAQTPFQCYLTEFLKVGKTLLDGAVDCKQKIAELNDARKSAADKINIHFASLITNFGTLRNKYMETSRFSNADQALLNKLITFAQRVGKADLHSAIEVTNRTPEEILTKQNELKGVDEKLRIIFELHAAM